MAADPGTLVELALDRAEAEPDLPLFTFLERGERAGQPLTAAGLCDAAERIAGALQARAAPGARVVLVLPNRLDFVTAFMGCLFAGMVAVPATIPRSDGVVPRFRALVDAAGAAIVLTNAATLRALGPLIEDHPEALGTLSWTVLESLDPAPWRAPMHQAGALAFVQFTSGSTGAPKGVMVSHANLMHNLGLLRQGMKPAADARIVSWLPFFHDWGLIGGLLQPLYLGAPTAILDPLDFLGRPLRWLRAVTAHGATISGAPNFAYDLCLGAAESDGLEGIDLSRWTTAIVSAEPVRPATMEAFVARFAPAGFRATSIYTSYGLAEHTLTATGSHSGHVPAVRALDRAALEREGRARAARQGAAVRRLASCGRAVGEVEMVIADPATCAALAEGQVGEVWLRSPSVARGYWRAPGPTAETFGAVLADGRGPWLRTGDLGFLLAGELYVTGRLRDLIIVAGRNLYPQDLELTMERCHPAARAGCAAAFAAEVAGREQLVLVQELDFGAQAAPDEVTAAIQRAVARTDGVFADVIVLVRPGAVPKTTSGKIRRKECLALWEAGRLPVISEWRNRESAGAERGVG